MFENLSTYKLGILAKSGSEMAMLEIIKRKTGLLKKYSFGDEDRYQYLIMKIIEGVHVFDKLKVGQKITIRYIKGKQNRIIYNI